MTQKKQDQDAGEKAHDAREKAHDAREKAHDAREKAHDAEEKAQDAREKTHDAHEKAHDRHEKAHIAHEKAHEAHEVTHKKAHDAHKKAHAAHEKAHPSKAPKAKQSVKSEPAAALPLTATKGLMQEKTMILKQEQMQHRWFVVDAKGKILGRLATEIAKILRGRHKTTYTPHVDCGDGVIVINAEHICVTGAKEAQKTYHQLSRYPGSSRQVPYRTMKARKPEFIIEHAVKGMVPRTSQGRKQMTRLRVFAGVEHQMDAQKPVAVNI